MTVAEFITAVESNPLYVNHSVYLKSADEYGCVYKWLEKLYVGKVLKSIRREWFIELNDAETGELTAKTVVSSIEVTPAE